MKLSDLLNPPKLTPVPLGECKCGAIATIETAKLTPKGPIEQQKVCQCCFEKLLDF
jgi:hypothetical protein